MGTSSKTSKVLQYFRRLIILKSLRPDRLMSGIQQTVSQVFGEEYLQPMELDLSYVIEKESNASSPLLLASMPGHDAVGLVDDLAAKMKKQMRAIAIGSPEGFELADKSIYAATKSGGWVLLKNIHLAPQWLSKLEKKLHSLNPNKNFRLFMTSEIHPKIPASLHRQSHIFSFEPPPGVKANMLHTLSAVDQGRMEQKPREPLASTLCWLGSTRSLRNVCAMLLWVGRRCSSLVTRTSVVRWRPLTIGSTVLRKVVTTLILNAFLGKPFVPCWVNRSMVVALTTSLINVCWIPSWSKRSVPSATMSTLHWLSLRMERARKNDCQCD